MRRLLLMLLLSLALAGVMLAGVPIQHVAAAAPGQPAATASYDYDGSVASNAPTLVPATDPAIRPVETPARDSGRAYDSPANSVATNAIRYGPTNPGPLDDAIAATFRSGSYSEVVLDEATTLYRVYGGEVGQLGSYWSRTAPTGPMQAQVDLALYPQWGNLATDVASIRVPAGTTIFEGAAAAQSLPGGGTLLGGGSQVYIPRVYPDWLLP